MQKATTKHVRFNLKRNTIHIIENTSTTQKKPKVEYKITITHEKKIGMGTGAYLKRQEENKELLKKMGFPLTKKGKIDQRYAAPQVLKKDGSRDKRHCLYTYA